MVRKCMKRCVFSTPDLRTRANIANPIKKPQKCGFINLGSPTRICSLRSPHVRLELRFTCSRQLSCEPRFKPAKVSQGNKTNHPKWVIYFNSGSPTRI